MAFAIDSHRLDGFIDPNQLVAEGNPNAGSPVLKLSGPAGRQNDTYPLAYSVTDFAD